MALFLRIANGLLDVAGLQTVLTTLAVSASGVNGKLCCRMRLHLHLGELEVGDGILAK